MTELWNCDTKGGNNPGRIAELGGRPLWSSEGKYLVVTQEKFTEKNGWEFETWRLTAGGSKEAQLPLPKGHAVRDWSSDGKWFLTASCSDPKEMPSRLSVMRPDGTGKRSFPKESPKEEVAKEGRFSPDSRQLAYVLQKGGDVIVWVAGLDGSNPRKVFEGENTGVAGLCWSPDAKRLAVALHDLVPKNTKTVVSVSSLRFRLVVVDANGENLREVHLADTTAIFLACPEWREVKQ
jgi:Tol biopolymer transport system component